MRKTFYFLTRFSALLFAMMLMATSLSAIDIVWTGAVSSDASDLANWEPQQAITEGDVIVVDSAYKFTNQPVFSGMDTVLINNWNLSQTAEITIDLNTPEGLFKIATETPPMRGIINIKQGVFETRRTADQGHNW